MAAITRIKFSWDKKDTLFPLLEESLYEADKKGYSVIEISRILGNATCINMYGLMRDAGIIAKLPRRGWWNKLEVHPALAEALAKTKLSFVQWTNSHGLDASQASLALKTVVDSTNEMSLAAHAALQQDFRFLAPKIYGLPVPLGRLPSKDATTPPRYSVTINPDPSGTGYNAYVHELAECVSFGDSMDLAYIALKSRYVIFNSIRTLRLLPRK